MAQSNPPQAVAGMVNAAGQAFVEGNYPKALKFLKKAYAIYPDANILWNMARCYEEMHDFEGALRAYRIYVAMDVPAKSKKEGQRRIKLVKQKWASQLEDKAANLKAKGRIGQAISMYKHAYSLVNDPIFLWKMGRLYHDQGDLESAIAMLSRFLKQKPGADEAAAARQDLATIKLELQNRLIQRARKEAKAGHYDMAMDLLQSGLKLRHDPAVKWEIAELYLKMGQKKQALKEYKGLLKLNIDPDMRQVVRQRIKALSPKRKTGSGKVFKIVAYAVGGVAIGLLTTGGVLTYMAGKDFDRLDGAEKDVNGNITGMSQARAASLQDSAVLKQKLSWLMYGIGGAAVVTSVVLYVVGRHKDSAPKVMAVPMANGGLMMGLYKEF